MNLLFLALIVAAYLLGSIPFGLIITKAHGKDLRSIGSGNIGSTNVGRALGKNWAYVCFGLDVLKGFLPMQIAILLLQKPPTVGDFWLWLCVACAAVLGHIFPVYIKFKGGKGIATSLGVMLGLFPYYTVCGITSFAVWYICLKIWKYVSLGSIVAAIAFPVTLITAITVKDNWQFVNLWPLVIVSITMTTLVILRHVENIKRLLEGSENKVKSK
jgi:glycerol-3-phosphate acyltransferase PlsY